MKEQKKRRGFGSWSLARRIVTAVAVVGILGASVAIPAGAASGSPQTATTPQLTGMAAEMQRLLVPAPASFRAQLQTYMQTVATSKSYGNLQGAAQISAKAATAQSLIGKADSHDLSILYYVLSQITNWQSQPKALIKAAATYAKFQKYVQAFRAQKAGKLHDNSVGTECSYAFATSFPGGLAAELALQAPPQIADIIDGLVADSDLVTALGEGVTIPVSPYKIITQVVKLVLVAIADTYDTLYQVNFWCVQFDNYAQGDQLDSYIKTDLAQKTLTVHATGLDTYHYQFSVQFEGQPVDPTNETLFQLYQQTGNSVLTPADITSQVTFTRLDTGLYQFTIPTTAVGSAYRLKIEYDNGQDENHNTLAYFGDTVFTHNSQ